MTLPKGSRIHGQTHICSAARRCALRKLTFLEPATSRFPASPGSFRVLRISENTTTITLPALCAAGQGQREACLTPAVARSKES